MRMDFPLIKPLALAITALFMSSALHAADESNAAGVVVMVVGQVTASGRAGGEHPLQRRSNIYSGETIITGKDSRVQIRFSDGSLVSLQEGSRFRIENFSYKQENKGDNATYQLIKGGMRTISGAVGKVNRDEYKVETPVATIGIRGTDYELMLHDSDNSGSDELYGYINDGVINAANKAGKKDFADNEFFKIVGPDMPPQPLLNPPGFMFEGYVPESTAKEEGGLRQLDPTLVPLLTRIDTSDLLNATINPMMTPFSTVSQITGQHDYVFDTTLSGGPLPIVQNGPTATSVYSLIAIDFSSQTILGGYVNATLSDASIMSGNITPTTSPYTLSDVIAKGQSMALSGSHSTITTTGTLSLQFLGPEAQGAIGQYFITEVPGAKPPTSVSGSAIYAKQPTSGW